MSKRYFKGNNSPAKRVKLDVTRKSITSKEKTHSQNVKTSFEQDEDLWGDDFGQAEIEEMDYIASQATQEEAIFPTPKPVEFDKDMKDNHMQILQSTSYDQKEIFKHTKIKQASSFGLIKQSQILGSSDIHKEIFESTQAIMFDDFENNVQSKSHNSTFRSRQDVPNNNIVLVTDDDEVETWKEEKKKLLEDFMTKEGETEFLRQQLNQIQVRAENTRKEQNRLMEDQNQKFRTEINALLKEKNALESQLQYQSLSLSTASDKCKMLETGSVKFTQPQANIIKVKDRSLPCMNWTSKKIKTKECSIQVQQIYSHEVLKTNFILYPLKIIPQCIFEPPEPEKSVVDIKIEEKIGKRNLAIIQDEETFRIFENPELSKPKVTIVNDKILTTEFFLPDLGNLINKTENEVNSSYAIPFLNKLVAIARELLLNSTLVLQKISQAIQNDDIRDMNELYLSEFYEMPVLHTRCFCEARAWYEFERGIETRRAVGIMSYIALTSKYLADYVAGNIKLMINKDFKYDTYTKEMKSYNEWDKKGFAFEFLDLISEFVTVVGNIRRSHQFTGLINAIMALIANVQANVGFTEPGLKRVCTIVKEIIYSRPVLTSFIMISSTLKEFSLCHSFVSKLCTSPDKSGINYWKDSFNFTPDACALEIFITQLEYFKMDPITLIKVTKDLAVFSNTALLTNSIPWLERTKDSCNCCLNLLKFVVINMCECSKINVEELKNKYLNCDITWRISKSNRNDKNHKINWMKELSEDWNNYEKIHQENFWESLKTFQSSAIAYGIRLLSFLAKRDVDFMIRLTFIEDAFHLFLNNLSQRKDLQLKKSDEIALDIVKKAFVLEKMKEENKINQQNLNIVKLESERWTDFAPSSSDLIKLYEDTL